MRMIFLCMIALIIAGPVHSRKKKKQENMMRIQLNQLTEKLENVRDSLENETAERYNYKQGTVEQRELDKEKYEVLRSKQESVLLELSKIKEEALVKEQNLSQIKSNAKDKKEEWTFLKNGLDDLMQKEGDVVIEAFPTDVEDRRAALEEVRRVYKENGNPIISWEKFVAYKVDAMLTGRDVEITQKKLLPDDGGPRMFSIARFGNVFGYCMDSSQSVYMIRQTGRLGKEKYIIQQILSDELSEYVVENLPNWINANRISGMIKTEIMQNEQAKLLVEGEQTTLIENFVHHIKSGGWVMIPLLALPFWVIFLVIQKIMQFATRESRFKKQVNTVLRMLDKDEETKALSYVKKHKGLMARVIEACLESPKDREIAENNVRKLIFKEIPVLNGNINTIAVIAGAAPLMGLLGTISGMIALFAAVTYYGTGDPKFLAGGISEALVTSQTGLAIAIPTLFAHDFIRNKKEKMVADIEIMSQAILDKIVPET